MHLLSVLSFSGVKFVRTICTREADYNLFAGHEPSVHERIKRNLVDHIALLLIRT